MVFVETGSHLHQDKNQTFQKLDGSDSPLRITNGDPAETRTEQARSFPDAVPAPDSERLAPRSHPK